MVFVNKYFYCHNCFKMIIVKNVIEGFGGVII